MVLHPMARRSMMLESSSASKGWLQPAASVPGALYHQLLDRITLCVLLVWLADCCTPTWKAMSLLPMLY